MKESIKHLTNHERKHPLDSYLRKGMIPHIWCPGCGNGVILNCFLQALKELHFNLDNLVVVSGIGCMGRISGYINADAFHTTHGRAIPFALGVKLAKPELKVVVFGGDGDLLAIGANHLIQAARRNIELTVILSNNFNYGMTGGQCGPTTPLNAVTTTSPYGNVEHPFNAVYLAAGSGATYVARWTAYHVRNLVDSIKKALLKKGFSFIEVISPCPEIYGRHTKHMNAVEMMKWLKQASIIQNKIDPIKAEITQNIIVVGEFVDKEKPEYTDLIWGKIGKVERTYHKE